jgi:predicted nucleic acid-binding protein
VIVLLDTDVIIDVALDRLPHAEYSAVILDFAEFRKITAYMAWHSLANFYYLVSAASGDKKTRRFIKELLLFTKVSETTTADAAYAVESALRNFEDALQMAAARNCSAEYIITRNIRHYKKSIIPAITPQRFIERYH